MTEEQIRAILDQVAKGKLTATAAMRELRELPFMDLGFAKFDSHRALRRGVPEVVIGQNKTPEQIALIGKAVIKSGGNLIITRLSADKARRIRTSLRRMTYYPEAQLGAVIVERPRILGHGEVMVISAGTSDIPVAEEAALCAEMFGNRVERLYDVGVAGLHRLTAHLDTIRNASVLVVVAGMEGALPSVIAGLVDKPVVGLPTSCGYGTAFGGITPLLSMLNTCAGGLTVVN